MKISDQLNIIQLYFFYRKASINVLVILRRNGEEMCFSSSPLGFTVQLLALSYFLWLECSKAKREKGKHWKHQRFSQLPTLLSEIGLIFMAQLILQHRNKETILCHTTRTFPPKWTCNYVLVLLPPNSWATISHFLIYCKFKLNASLHIFMHMCVKCKFERCCSHNRTGLWG